MPGQVTDLLERIDRGIQGSVDTLHDLWQLQTIQLNILMQMSLGGTAAGAVGGFQPGFRVGTTQHLQSQVGSLIGSTFSSFMGSNSPFTAFGNLFSTFGNQISKIDNPIAKVIGGLISLGGTALRSVDIIQNWSRSLAQADMQFAKVSPAMALVEARQELRDVSYGIKMGGRLTPSTEALNQAFSRFREERADLDVAFKSTLNHAATGILNDLRRLLHLVQSGDMKIDLTELTTDQEMQKAFSNASDNFWHGVPVEEHGKPQRFKKSFLGGVAGAAGGAVAAPFGGRRK